MKTLTSKVISPPMSYADWLSLLFIALKLCGNIGWSWWWVLLPLYVQPIAELLFDMCDGSKK